VNPAMLVYLDNATNRVGAEQENFGRELMELFTLGVGHYTELDVIAMATNNPVTIVPTSTPPRTTGPRTTSRCSSGCSRTTSTRTATPTAATKTTASTAPSTCRRSLPP